MSNNVTEDDLPAVIVVIPEEVVLASNADRQDEVRIPVWMRAVLFMSSARHGHPEEMDAMVSAAWLSLDSFSFHDERKRIPLERIAEHGIKIREALDFLRIPNFRLPKEGQETSEVADDVLSAGPTEEEAYYAEIARHLPMVQLEIVQSILSSMIHGEDISNGPWAMVHCAYRLNRESILQAMGHIAKESEPQTS